MKVIITITDDGENSANVNIEFEPRLTPENETNPAATVAMMMLDTVSNDITEVTAN